MRESSIKTDFALETTEDRVEAVMRMETLLGPHSLERYRKVCFAFADEQRELSVGQLRLTLQLEDHLDWLLRNDMSRLQLWRLDSRRADALAISRQIADLWQALGVCLGRYALGATEWLKSREDETGLLPLTIAVALHCHVNELRWRARAELPCDVPLKALHRLYAIAEARNIAEQEVYPYESDVDFSITPKGQYVLMLLMADLAERDLQPVQRLIAQNWLSSWAHDVGLSQAPVPGNHSMLVNLDSDQGIQRIAEKTEPTYRYINIHVVARRIEETDAWLANSNYDDDTTKELTEATESDFSDTLASLEKLYHDRSAAFQAARERQPAPPDRFAQVIVGWNLIQDFLEASSWEAKSGRGTFPAKCPSPQKFGAAGEALARSSTDLPLIDAHFGPEPEHRNSNNFLLWRIRDLSAGGIGLASARTADADISVGTLILVAVEGEASWSLGRIVRKFKGLDENDTRFGIQLIGQDAVPVHLIPRQSEDQAKRTLMSAVSGLFLCRPDETERQDLMLVSSGALAHTRRFELKTGNKRLPIRASLPVQSAGAWVMIQFEEDV
ncbi:MAG: hypothetical protein IPP88_06830 [Betaproteobacteria bacterium]|nr:hypothetical protein [Betaproteobacteria bacterium]